MQSLYDVRHLQRHEPTWSFDHLQTRNRTVLPRPRGGLLRGLESFVFLVLRFTKVLCVSKVELR